MNVVPAPAVLHGPAPVTPPRSLVVSQPQAPRRQVCTSMMAHGPIRNLRNAFDQEAQEAREQDNKMDVDVYDD